VFPEEIIKNTTESSSGYMIIGSLVSVIVIAISLF
jgi:hypothetical protein